MKHLDPKFTIKLCVAIEPGHQEPTLKNEQLVRPVMELAVLCEQHDKPGENKLLFERCLIASETPPSIVYEMLSQALSISASTLHEVAAGKKAAHRMEYRGVDAAGNLRIISEAEYFSHQKQNRKFDA